MSARFRRLCARLANRNGAISIEYGLIIALITIGLIVSMTFWGETANGMYMRLVTGANW